MILGSDGHLLGQSSGKRPWIPLSRFPDDGMLKKESPLFDLVGEVKEQRYTHLESSPTAQAFFLGNQNQWFSWSS